MIRFNGIILPTFLINVCFRDQIGVDQLTWDNGVGFREPFIEYAFGHQLIQTIQYQNDRLQPAVQTQSDPFYHWNFDLVREIYKNVG